MAKHNTEEENTEKLCRKLTAEGKWMVELNKEMKSSRERADMERTAKKVRQPTLGVRRPQRGEKMRVR